MNNVEVKVDAQKGALGFRGKFDNICASFHPIHIFHPLLSYDNSPQWLPCRFLLGIVFGFWVFTSWGLVEHSWASFSFSMWIMPRLLCSCPCLLDVIFELHVMNETMFNDFLIGKWKWILYVVTSHLFQKLIFCICSGGIYDIVLKSLV